MDFRRGRGFRGGQSLRLGRGFGGGKRFPEGKEIESDRFGRAGANWDVSPMRLRGLARCHNTVLPERHLHTSTHCSEEKPLLLMTG